MAMALADLERSVYLVCQRIGLNLAGPGAQSHRASQLLYSSPLTQFVNHPTWRRWIELARICIRQPHNIARKLDARRLHSQANAKIRNFFLTGVANRNQHPLNATFAESAWNQNSVIAFQLCLYA